MTYTIRGAYPRYVITDDQGNEDTASDFATVMRSFTHKLQQGDSIYWEAP